jgi:hypothetical protein
MKCQIRYRIQIRLLVNKYLSLFLTRVKKTGKFNVTGFAPKPNGESHNMKVKLRLSVNGIFSVCGAHIIDTVEVAPSAATDDSKVGDDSINPAPMDTGAEQNESMVWICNLLNDYCFRMMTRLMQQTMMT